MCVSPTQRRVPAHVGDGAGDAAFAHAGRTGLVCAEEILCRRRWRAERLGCLGSG